MCECVSGALVLLEGVSSANPNLTLTLTLIVCVFPNTSYLFVRSVRYLVRFFSRTFFRTGSEVRFRAPLSKRSNVSLGLAFYMVQGTVDSVRFSGLFVYTYPETSSFSG